MGRELPDSVARAVRTQHPEEAWRLEGRPPSPAAPPRAKPPAPTPAAKAEKTPATTAAPLEDPAGEAPPRRAKYGNRRVVDPDSGERFDSRLEWRVWLRLVELHGRRNVLRQVAFMLPGRLRMKPDFVVMGTAPGGERTIARILDAKGAEPTRDWVNKRKLMEATHGLEVEIIRHPDDLQDASPPG